MVNTRPASHYIHYRRNDDDGRSRHAFSRRVALRDARRWEQRLALLRDHPIGAVRLWASVLDEAIKDLTWARAPHHSEGGRRELVRATLAWLTEPDDNRTPGAFAWICRELELPAEAVRWDVLSDARVGEEMH